MINTQQLHFLPLNYYYFTLTWLVAHIELPSDYYDGPVWPPVGWNLCVSTVLGTALDLLPSRPPKALKLARSLSLSTSPARERERAWIIFDSHPSHPSIRDHHNLYSYYYSYSNNLHCLFVAASCCIVWLHEEIPAIPAPLPIAHSSSPRSSLRRSPFLCAISLRQPRIPALQPPHPALRYR